MIRRSQDFWQAQETEQRTSNLQCCKEQRKVRLLKCVGGHDRATSESSRVGVLEARLCYLLHVLGYKKGRISMHMSE